MMGIKKRIAIIGSGASGIAAARSISHIYGDQVDLTLFEKNDYIGGKSRTTMIDGRNYELGSGLIISSPLKKTVFHKALDEANVTLENARKDKRGIVYYSGGKVYKSPDEYNVKALFSTKRLFRYVRDVPIFVFRQLQFDLMIKLNRHPHSRYFAMPLDKNYGLWFVNRFAFGMQGFGYADTSDSKLCPATYYYHQYFDFRMLFKLSVIVKEGTQTIWERLAAEFKEDISLGTTVTSLEKQGSQVLVNTDKGSEKFDYVINTLALPTAFALSTLSQSEEEITKHVKCNPYVTVMAELANMNNIGSFNMDTITASNRLGEAMFVYKRYADSAICTINVVLKDENTDDETIIDHTAASLEEGFGATMVDKKSAQVVRWKDYFSYLEGEQISDGWFEEFENEIQAKHGILYIGSGLHFESLEQSYNYSYKRVKDFLAKQL